MSSTGGTSASTARSFWIYFWIYTGLVLGALASVSANIAYTYIPPHIQPAWWPRSRLWDPADYIPPAGNVAVAVFCPVAIFILTEVITRPRWREGKLSFAVRAISAVMVGLPVAVASYLHLCSLLEYYSTIPFIAYTLPLTVDGLMLACTAALQLTGVEVSKDQAEQNHDQASLAEELAALPHPRAALDNTTQDLLVVPASLATATVTQRAAITTPETTEGLEHPPVGPATSTGGRPSGPVGRPAPQPSPPVDTQAEHRKPVAPPVGLLGPPAGAGLLPLKLLGPPLSPREPGPEPPVDGSDTAGGELFVPGSTGGRGTVKEEGVPDRPVPFGRLGAADLSDVAIIALALADNPNGRITGTALRRDFGVGPNRAARIRDEIGKRRQATRLATRLRERIEQIRTAQNESAAQPSETDDERFTSPDSADMGSTIKTPPDFSRQGP
jgi:hypothetical protein